MSDLAQVPVMAAARWLTNGHLLEDVARLGYLRKEWVTLDCTFGRGTWWKRWKPDELVTHDIKIDGVDFRHLPEANASFDAVAYDPPYRLNGRPDKAVDERYGTDVASSWQDRHALIKAGMTECVRVLKLGGVLIQKCQAQVASGAVRWQDLEFANYGAGRGLVLIDRFDMLGGRPQPRRSRADGAPSVQQHARRAYSTLLVFKKGPTPWPP